MKKDVAASLFECLSSAVRLDVFRLLVRRGLEGAVAGEIATALKVAPNNLSFHLKALVHAKLATVQQEGRYQRYAANLPLMLELVGYLTDECCAEQSTRCGGGKASLDCCDGVVVPKTKGRKRGE